MQVYRPGVLIWRFCRAPFLHRLRVNKVSHMCSCLYLHNLMAMTRWMTPLTVYKAKVKILRKKVFMWFVKPPNTVMKLRKKRRRMRRRSNWIRSMRMFMMVGSMGVDGSGGPCWESFLLACVGWVWCWCGNTCLHRRSFLFITLTFQASLLIMSHFIAVGTDFRAALNHCNIGFY